MKTPTERLTAELVGKIPPAWASVISVVDRARFIPARIWVYDDHNDPQPLDRDTDPQRWWQVVYSDTAIMTQFDNGATTWPDTTGDHPTSSASQPSLVLNMLAGLDVRDGHRVLEIGTGTGYHAALLAAQLGDDAVTTIEIDTTLAQQAREHLIAAGYTPTVITADGTAGYPGNAPYDRIIATASIRPGQLPYSWVAQTRPGGIIVTPWGPDYHNGVMARLVVHDDATASGRLSSNLAFMRLRAQQDPACPLDDVETGDAQDTTTSLWVYQVIGDLSGALTVGLLVPHCHKIVEDDPNDEYHHLVRVHDPATRSWATVEVRRGLGAYPVRQHGPRRLWDEIERAHAWWVHHGRPTYTRLGVTITDTQQWTWLDHPDQPVGLPARPEVGTPGSVHDHGVQPVWHGAPGEPPTKFTTTPDPQAQPRGASHGFGRSPLPSTPSTPPSPATPSSPQSQRRDITAQPVNGRRKKS